VSTPVHASAYRDAVSAIRRAAAAFWIRFLPHRTVSSSLGISLALHLAVFLVIGTSLYVTGEDETDEPELSVQLVSREGPNDEEYTEAAMPKPVPEPVEDVIKDPGTGVENLDTENFADIEPQQERAPDATVAEVSEAAEMVPTESAPVLTTPLPAEDTVAKVDEAAPDAVVAVMPKPEKDMVTRNVQQVALKLLDSNMTNTELTWQQDGQQYSARVMRQPAVDSTGIEQVIAEVMTSKDGKRMKTRLSLKRLAFSHFTQLVNNWDRNIQLHDDIIDGRFHSNTEFSFTSSKGVTPRFFGKVTTAAASLTFGGFNKRRNKEVFQGGYETRTERVTLPRDMPDVINGGEGGNRRQFADDTRIIFNPDGSYVWRHASGDGPLHREEASEQPRYLVGDKGAKLYVRGTVAGIFTVYSPHGIEIEDDLVYARDPRQTVMSRDFLALISGQDISIAPPDVTGPGDLNVHGALFARRRFVIENTDRGRSGEATLVLYGSLTAGSLSETEPRYATKVDFDKRFEYLRPASFPMTRRYEVDSWDQDWEAVEEPGGATGNLAQSN
jgi:hypothetical protein